MALVVAVTLAGCAEAVDPGGGGGDPGQTLRVETNQRPHADGMVYTEGSMVEVVLRDAAGGKVALRTVVPGGTVNLDGLGADTYVLEVATRACVGNCGVLDPATLPCERTIDLDADLAVRVDVPVDSPCEIRPA